MYAARVSVNQSRISSHELLCFSIRYRTGEYASAKSVWHEPLLTLGATSAWDEILIYENRGKKKSPKNSFCSIRRGGFSIFIILLLRFDVTCAIDITRSVEGAGGRKVLIFWTPYGTARIKIVRDAEKRRTRYDGKSEMLLAARIPHDDFNRIL